MLDEATDAGIRPVLMDALEPTGDLKPAQRRARRVLLRLIAGGPAFTFYERVRDRLDVIVDRSRISQMIADEIERLALDRPDFLERAKGRLLGGMVASQDNLEAIAIAALRHVEAMAEGQTDDGGEEIEPSPDWLNAFAREAEIASSDILQDRLARILAGEIARPGAFGKRAIRFAAEAEDEAMHAFALALQHRLGDVIVRDPHAWHQGEWFERGRMLESEGLIAGHEGFASRTIVLDAKGNGFFLGERLGLVAQGTPNSSRPVSIWTLTLLGRQIASLFPPTDETASAARLAGLLRKDGLERISVGPWVAAEGARYTVSPSTQLWARTRSDIN
jgi:hypothetical protein